MDKTDISFVFLQHFLIILREKMDKLSSVSKAPNEFEAGRSMAYYEISDLVLECCRLFNVQLSDLEIGDFDPERLL